MSDEIGEPVPRGPGRAKGAAQRNIMGASMGNTPVQSDGSAVLTQQARIAGLARKNTESGLDNIHPFMDIAWLLEAYQRTRKDGAPGVDSVTWEEYGDNLMP